MTVDSTNNIVYDFLTGPRFRLGRNTLFAAMLIGCLFGQVFLMFGERIELLGYVAYIVAAVLTVLYALLLYFNITFLVPRLLLRNKYVEYFTLLLVGTVAVLLCVKYLVEVPTLHFYGITDSFNVITLLDMFSSLIVTVVCITSSLIPMLVRQWLIDTRNIGHLENKRLRSTIDEFKNHINTELLYDIIGRASEEVKTDPDKASDMIISLSELLRYELYDCKREKVILHSDIEFTRNYLSLVKQVSASFAYSISVTGSASVFVHPFQFLSFIQEVLSQQPEKLDIHYAIDSAAVELRCEVSICNSSKTVSMTLELKEC